MGAKECVVIGAGLAGLSAAYHLTRKKWKVTVLEASDRLGGRVMTHRFDSAPHLNCELGGEWIGKDHLEMQALCKTFKLDLQEHSYANSFWNEKGRAHLIDPGKWCMSKDAEKIWKRFESKFKKFKNKQFKQLDQVDWWTLLSELGFEHEDLLRRDLMDSTDFGETIRMNSAYTAASEYLSTKTQKADKTDEMDFKVLGGNELLIDALADAIGRENIQTKSEVTEIIQESGRVHVRIKSRQKVSSDFCVCAIPAHTLCRIGWGKSSPKKKIEAARQLQYARITKTAVLCSERFWPTPEKGGFSVCTSLASDFCFDSTQGQPWPQGILCSYAVGDKADDITSSPLKDLKNWIVEDVANAYELPWSSDKSERVALDIKRQPWQGDRFTGGAYAFYRPGQWFTLRKPLMEPFKKVFFAGEHIADAQGFMEGAVTTGKKAATDILKW